MQGDKITSLNKKAAIIGARGYAGLELARLLLKHPYAELSLCFSGDSNFQLSDYLTEKTAQAVPVLPLRSLVGRISDILNGINLIFLATPIEVSAEWAPILVKAGKTVIDLSGAFRTEDGALGDIYGLSPWNNAQSSHKLIANPGCYATAALMGVLPLLKENCIDPQSLVIDAKSGTTGAGRKPSEALLFTEVDGNCLPYRVGKHQHLPEISLHAELISGTAIEPFFCTSLLPTRRGIIAAIYARLLPGVGAQQVHAAFEKAYVGYELVRFGDLSQYGATQQSQMLSLRKVVGTAQTHLFFEVVGDKLYLFSLIDNLLKGAASQAVENFNRLNGLPVSTGLTALEEVL